METLKLAVTSEISYATTNDVMIHLIRHLYRHVIEFVAIVWGTKAVTSLKDGRNKIET